MRPFETIIRKGKTYALLPVGELKKLAADVEMLADVRSYDAAKARLARGESELIPFELAERRANGECPLKIWRGYRGLTQEKLAKASRVTRAMIAAIEAGRKQGSIGTIKKLARALNVSVEQLV